MRRTMLCKLFFSIPAIVQCSLSAGILTLFSDMPAEAERFKCSLITQDASCNYVGSGLSVQSVLTVHFCPAAFLLCTCHYIDHISPLLNVCTVHNGVLIQNRESFPLSQCVSHWLMNIPFSKEYQRTSPFNIAFVIRVTRLKKGGKNSFLTISV